MTVSNLTTRPLPGLPYTNSWTRPCSWMLLIAEAVLVDGRTRTGWRAIGTPRHGLRSLDTLSRRLCLSRTINGGGDERGCRDDRSNSTLLVCLTRPSGGVSVTGRRGVAQTCVRFLFPARVSAVLAVVLAGTGLAVTAVPAHAAPTVAQPALRPGSLAAAQQQAKETGSAVEILAERDEYSQIFANPDEVET
jgi:hypothetical protein